MQSSIVAVLITIAFAAAAASADDTVVPCLHPEWKKTCQSTCLKIGPNIQFNRCYDFTEANLMCKCNDQDLTTKILAMFKDKETPAPIPAPAPAPAPTQPSKETTPTTTTAPTTSTVSTTTTAPTTSTTPTAPTAEVTDSDATTQTETEDTEEIYDDESNESPVNTTVETEASAGPVIKSETKDVSAPATPAPPVGGPQGVCVSGTWDCDGNSTKICNNGAWVTLGCPTATKCVKHEKSVVCGN